MGVFSDEVKFVLSLCSTKEVKMGVFIDEINFVRFVFDQRGQIRSFWRSLCSTKEVKNRTFKVCVKFVLS